MHGDHSRYHGKSRFHQMTCGWNFLLQYERTDILQVVKMHLFRSPKGVKQSEKPQVDLLCGNFLNDKN